MKFYCKDGYGNYYAFSSRKTRDYWVADHISATVLKYNEVPKHIRRIL
jgi:hypothetical protein